MCRFAFSGGTAWHQSGQGIVRMAKDFKETGPQRSSESKIKWPQRGEVPQKTYRNGMHDHWEKHPDHW